MEPFGHISWVPEVDLFGSYCRKSQIIRSLRPLQVNNFAFTSFDCDQLDFSLQVVNSYSMFVVHVNAGYVAAAWAQAYSLDASRILLKLERVNFLASNCVPHVN